MRFDRPLRQTSPTLHYDLRPARGGRERFPEITKHEFAERGRAFRMTVRLEPERDYELFLNRPSGGAFASADGVTLAPYQIKFRTRAKSK